MRRSLGGLVSSVRGAAHARNVIARCFTVRERAEGWGGRAERRRARVTVNEAAFTSRSCARATERHSDTDLDSMCIILFVCLCGLALEKDCRFFSNPSVQAPHTSYLDGYSFGRETEQILRSIDCLSICVWPNRGSYCICLLYRFRPSSQLQITCVSCVKITESGLNMWRHLCVHCPSHRERMCGVCLCGCRCYTLHNAQKSTIVKLTRLRSFVAKCTFCVHS